MRIHRRAREDEERDGQRSVYEARSRAGTGADGERRETRLSMDPRSGEVWPTGEPRPPRVDDLDELDWTELGGIDRQTGRSTVDLEKARRWRPL